MDKHSSKWTFDDASSSHMPRDEDDAPAAWVFGVGLA
jgi:hypothetical protein